MTSPCATEDLSFGTEGLVVESGRAGKSLQQTHYFHDLDVSYPSVTQIISRKNPEDVQEVRHWLLIFLLVYP